MGGAMNRKKIGKKIKSNYSYEQCNEPILKKKEKKVTLFI